MSALTKYLVGSGGQYIGAYAGTVRRHPAVYAEGEPVTVPSDDPSQPDYTVPGEPVLVSEAWDETIWPDMPADAVEVPTAPQDARQVWDGEQWGAVPASEDDVIAERRRRLAMGFDYNFGDARGVHRIGTTEADMLGWDEVTQIALVRSAMGSSETIAVVTNTGPVLVTPAEWLAILEAAAAFRQPIWAVSFVLATMQPIPTDYAADSWWS